MKGVCVVPDCVSRAAVVWPEPDVEWPKPVNVCWVHYREIRNEGLAAFECRHELNIRDAT
jgi:hypothetical protein